MPASPKELEHKALVSFEIKNADKGEVEACVATMGVVDRDGDIIDPGAIPTGTKVAMSGYGHDAVFGAAPVGKGVISIKGNKAVFSGRMFLNTTAGRDAFALLKEMGSDQEWSFGYRVMQDMAPNDEQMKQGCQRVLTKLAAFEVSPVIMGAGIGTQTMAVKSVVQADGDTTEPEAKIADREDTSPQEGADKYGDVTFADPVNKKYPIDTEEHIRAAWNYINHPNAADKYSAADLETIKNRIIAAWKDKIDKEGPPSAAGKSASEIEAETKAAEQARLRAEADQRAIDEEMDRFTRNMKRYA